MKFDHTTSYFYIFVGEDFNVRFDFTDSLSTGGVIAGAESLDSATVVMINELGVDVTSTMISGQSTLTPYHYFNINNTLADETYQITITGVSSGSNDYVSRITVESFGTITLNANVADPNANSYVSLKEADSYIRNVRGHGSTWDTLSFDGKKRLLIEAARDIDKLGISGTKYYDFQSMEFPRSDHDKITGDVATPITVNSFKNTSFTSDTYGADRSNTDYWKYGAIHITNATPLNDVRAITSSNITTDVVTVITDFSATPTVNTDFIAFEPIGTDIKNAQCEQALYIIENTHSEELSAYGATSKEVEIGDVRVKFRDNFSETKQGYSSATKKLMSKWLSGRILRVYRS
jgi:hypothetical protein